MPSSASVTLSPVSADMSTKAEQNRHTYEMAAKEMVKQVTKERHEAIQKLHEVRQRQTVERREREVKLSQLKFSIEQLEAEKQEVRRHL